MILSHNKSDKELRKDINDLRKELREDIKGVENYIKSLQPSEFMPKVAVNKFHELDKTIKEKGISNMSTEELKTVYRDLEYIRTLKTSTVEGAIKSKQLWQPIEEKLSTFGKREKRRFFKAYDKLYEEIPVVMQFKYQLFDIASENAKEMTQAELIKYMKTFLGFNEATSTLEILEKPNEIPQDETGLVIQYETRKHKRFFKKPRNNKKS